MKKILFGAAALTLVVLGACKKEVKTEDRSLQAGALVVCDTVVLPNVISGTLSLTNDKVYILNGKTYVANGGVLNIAAGTRIEGIRKDSARDASALVITKGGKLNAIGDSCNPIVFTTRINGSNATANPGDWGGIVILGKSTVNKTNPVIEGIDLPSLPVGIDVTYGGTDTLDNSGTLAFVRIEYAGAVVAPNKELNGLTLGGVGSGTTLHHIEVAWGADDAFEFFGGTVNAKYLVALAMNDDGLDFDYGYRGAIQFAVVVRPNCCFTQTFADANGIECDNDENGSNDLPRTRPVLSNITIVGGSSQLAGTLDGARFRRNTDVIWRNSYVLGYGDGSATFAIDSLTNAKVSEIKYNNVYRISTTTGNWDNFAIDASNTLGTGTSALLAAFTCGTNGTGLNYAPASAATANFTTGWPTDIRPTTTEAFLNKTVTYRGAFPSANRNWLGCWSKCIGFLPATMNCD